MKTDTLSAPPEDRDGLWFQAYVNAQGEVDRIHGLIEKEETNLPVVYALQRRLTVARDVREKAYLKLSPAAQKIVEKRACQHANEPHHRGYSDEFRVGPENPA